MMALPMLSSSLIGCGGDAQPPLVLVSGVVTFYGEPARAEVIFQPVAEDGKQIGRPSTAHTREDGSFTLQYNRNRWGAMISRHDVTVKILRPLVTKNAKTFQEAAVPIKEVHLQRIVRENGNHYVFAITK